MQTRILEVTCMFDIFNLFISSHSHIFIFLGSCALACILASSYLYVRVYLLVSSHPYILISSGSYALACIPASSYSQVRVCLLVSFHPHILISSGSYVLASILASLHPHILRLMCACLYSCIFRSSYPQAHVWLLVSLHLTSSYPQVYVCLLVCSHPQVNVFSIRINKFILESSNSVVLGNCASEFVNNLQILRTIQAFVLDFYGTSRNIYRKQPLRADLRKRF